MPKWTTMTEHKVRTYLNDRIGDTSTLVTDTSAVRDEVVLAAGTDLPALVASHNDLRSYQFGADGIIGQPPGLVNGSTTSTSVRLTAGKALIGGEVFHYDTQEVVLAGTITAAGNLWGGWRFEVNRLGVVTSTNFGATMAEASEQNALLSFGAVALTADTAVVGYLALQGGVADFVGGTDDPVVSDANVNALTYYDSRGPLSTGVATSSTLAVGATPEQINQGAVTVKVRGKRLAEISADTGLTFTAADTIGVSQFGGWLLLSSLAGTAVITQSSDGDPAATAQTHASAAARDAELVTLRSQLPDMFAVVGELAIANDASGWTANTDDMTDASDVTTAVFTVDASGAHDTATAGLRQLAIPAAASAATSSAPAAMTTSAITAERLS